MRHTRLVRSLVSFGLLWSAAVFAAPVPSNKPHPEKQAPIRLPEGIADAEGRIGFFASATNGIEAIDLANGKVLWHTHEAQRPLLLDGDHLLAQAGIKRNRLRILRLDVKRNGECDFESDPLVLPPWVVPGEAHGHSFAAHWHKEKHHLVLDWEANAWYTGKTRPTPAENSAASKHACGIARIDLRTGQVDVQPSSAEPQKPASASSSPLPEQLEKKALRWQGIVGQYWKVLALEEEKGQQFLVLHSWDRQKATEQQPQELLRGKRLLVRATLDEHVLCLREANPGPNEHASFSSGAGEREKPSKWWWLFSVESGKLLGRIPDEAGMNTLAVLGKRVFYLVPGTLRGQLDQPNVQPQILRAVDLTSGNKLWDHPVAGKLIAPPPL